MVSIVIEPFEPLIQKAIETIEKKVPGYFNGIKKIVIESGDPGHFGKVKSDQEDVIYISINKIKSAVGSGDDEVVIDQIAKTLAHEMGHIKSKFQGGEAPAESEEKQMGDRLITSRLNKKIRAARYLKRLGAMDSNDPVALSKSILSIVNAFSSKVKPENRQMYISNMRMNIQRSVSPMELSGRKKNPGAGIGSAISVTKNILAGHSPEIISRTIALVLSGLGSL
jgi:hypothetical protein